MVRSNQLVCSPKKLQHRTLFASKLKLRKSSSQEPSSSQDSRRKLSSWRNKSGTASTTESTDCEDDEVDSTPLEPVKPKKKSFSQKIKRTMSKKWNSSRDRTNDRDSKHGSHENTDGVQALTQASESIEDAEKRGEDSWAEKRRSAESAAKRRSLRDAMEDLLENDKLPSELAFEESNESPEDDEEEDDAYDEDVLYDQLKRLSCKSPRSSRTNQRVATFNVLEAVVSHEDVSILNNVLQYVSVREHVSLAQVSHTFLEAVTLVPLRLDYSKRVTEYRLLEQVSSTEQHSTRLSSWRVAGLYTALSELQTLFQVIDPADLKFIGLVNPRVRSLKQMSACVNLLRFELHGCETEIDLSPLLSLSNTLTGLSFLACNHIEDLKLVENLPHLRMLSVFRSARIDKLPDLSLCPNIEFLSAGECVDIAHLKPIRFLNHLQVLDLSFVRAVKSLDFLANATQLKTLILDSCKNLTSLQGLGHCGRSLEVLRLNNIMGLESLRGIESCHQLTSLEISSLILLKDLSPLESCEKLEDLLLLKCVHVRSLTPLWKSATSMRRLIISECRSLRSEDDVEVVEACSKLVVFECAGCHPTLLVGLMNSKRLNVLAAAENELPLLSVSDFEQVALPEIMRRLALFGDDKDEVVMAALRVVQACSANSVMLSLMIHEGVAEWLMSSLVSAEDATHSPSYAITLEILRTLSALLKFPDAASHVLGINDSVEQLAKRIVVSSRGSRDDLLEMDAMPGTTFEEERCTAEAARVLARVLQHTSGSERTTLTVRIINAGAPMAAVQVLSCATSMDRTRRPLILLLNTLLDHGAVEDFVCEDLALNLINHNLVPALLSASECCSIETQMLAVALLSSVSKAGRAGSTLVEVLCAQEGALGVLVALFNSTEDREVLRSIVDVLLETPPHLCKAVAGTPKLLSGMIACIDRELRFQERLHYSPQSDSSLMLLVINVLGVITRESAGALALIAEEQGIRVSIRHYPAGEIRNLEIMTSSQLVKDLHVVVLNGPSVTRVACARVIVNLAQHSEYFKSALIDLFRHSKAVKDIFMLAARGASSTTDTTAGLDLLLLLLEEPGVADIGARFSNALAHEFCKGMVKLAIESDAHLETVVHVIALLLASTSQRMVYTGVIVPLVTKVQKHKVQVQSRISRMLFRNRRRSSPSRISMSSQDSRSERTAALRFLVTLVKQEDNRDVLFAIGDVHVLENLVASLADDDRSCRDLAVCLLEAAMQVCVNPPPSQQKRFSGMEKILLQSFTRNPHLPRFSHITIQALTDLLDSGSPRARVASARLLAMVLSRNEELRASVMGNDFELTQSNIEGPHDSASDKESDDGISSSNASTVEDDEDGDTDGEGFGGHDYHHHPHHHQRIPSRQHNGSIGSIHDVDLPAPPPPVATAETSRWSQDFSLDTSFLKTLHYGLEQGIAAGGAIIRRERKLSASSEAGPSKVSQDDAENLLITLRNFLLDLSLSAVSTQMYALENDLESEVSAGCELLAALLEVDASRVQEFVLQPIVALLSGKTSTSEQNSSEEDLGDNITENVDMEEVVFTDVAEQERVVEVMWGLSNLNTNEIFDSLESLDAFSHLAEYISSDDSSSRIRRIGLRAIAKYIRGDVKKILRLDQESALLKRLLGEVIAENVEMYPAIVETFNGLQVRDFESSELASRLLDSGLLEAMQKWRAQLAEGGSERERNKPEIELGCFLFVPGMRAVSEAKYKISAAMSNESLSDLVAGLFNSEDCFEIRASLGRLLATIDSQFLDDTSELFRSTVAQSKSFDQLSSREMAYELEQLKYYPVAFNRVRGYPVPFHQEDIFRISVERWTTMAIKSHYPHTHVHLNHRRVYFEVELIDTFEADTVVGWVSDSFKSGVIRGFTSGGVNEDEDSWGIKLGSQFQPKDVVGLAADLDSGTLTFTRNGRSLDSVISLPASVQAVFPAVTTSGLTAFFNFGSRSFRFSAPSRNYHSVFRSVHV